MSEEPRLEKFQDYCETVSGFSPRITEARNRTRHDYFYQEMGLPAQLRDYDGRYNVACTVQSGRPGPHVVLCTHLDTVPPYEMEEPFHARVKDGRLYGRGAVDVRGTLAAMFAE